MLPCMISSLQQNYFIQVHNDIGLDNDFTSLEDTNHDF